MRKNSKSFEGLDQATIRAYHKSHISKVMAICTLAFAFVDNVENGGDAIKLDFSRCQSHKVAARATKESRRDENGKLHYNGEMIRNKGDFTLLTVQSPDQTVVRQIIRSSP